MAARRVLRRQSEGGKLVVNVNTEAESSGEARRLRGFSTCCSALQNMGLAIAL
jgi:hypothetical protein